MNTDLNHIPLDCNNCRRLEILVDKVISAAIESIAALHQRPPEGTTQFEEKVIIERATQIFMEQLKKSHLLPNRDRKIVDGSIN